MHLSWRLACLYLLSLQLAVSGTYADDQRAGLSKLYNSTGGANGSWNATVATNWTTAENTCYRVGVGCSDGIVTSIDLPGVGLAGNLSDAGPELWLLTQLEVLNLASNNLNGSLPTELSSLAALEKLDLSSNAFVGGLPTGWMQVEDATATPLVHTANTSATFPALRALLLSNNSLTQDVYVAVQTVLPWASLSTLDLSGNVLSGSLQGAFDLKYCSGDGTGSACGTNLLEQGAGGLTAFILSDSPSVSGDLPVPLPPSMTVLQLTNMTGLTGAVPESYADLRVLQLDGSTGLNATQLPAFMTQSSTSFVATQDKFCPQVLGMGLATGMSLSLDPSYLQYQKCYCGEGLQGGAGGAGAGSPVCELCPQGTYRSSADVLLGAACLACPLLANTGAAGATAIEECTCQAGTYKSYTGGGEFVCNACPEFSTYSEMDGGGSAAEVCLCQAGLYMVNATCVPCPAGTYKSVVGNDPQLCIPCTWGTYSELERAVGSENCTYCPSGTYSTQMGLNNSALCLPCPAGTYSDALGLFSPDLCSSCPAGTWSSTLGAGSSSACMACPQNHYSTTLGAASEAACIPCPSGSNGKSYDFACSSTGANSTSALLRYFVIAVITLLALIFVAFVYLHMTKRFKGHAKISTEQTTAAARLDVPYRMARAKLRAQLWAVFFHTLETVDIMAGISLFIFLLNSGDISGPVLIMYCISVSLGFGLTVHRLYMVWWAKYRLKTIFLELQTSRAHSNPHLAVFATQNRQRTRRELQTVDARVASELLKILRHLQVNKFKVQLVLGVDIPLTVSQLVCAVGVQD
eukprot:TRINITY_DN3956_c0_g1_i1.p1 TRINITY_DN3956_c0_g1~~TRINITY_DN3956_c0_g1_i1.p1  ORF type:complete len:805 (-),score=98.44 TRINITY_DN3956_c0_g1_i1:700-3114(-)